MLDNGKEKDTLLEERSDRFLSNGFVGSLQVIFSVLFCSFLLTFFSRDRDYTYGFLNVFLGYIFIFSAMIKLAHLLYFARHFSLRSFLASQWPIYAYVFPFIQLFFGLVLTSGSYVFLTSFFILIFMGELLITAFIVLIFGEAKEKKDNPSPSSFSNPNSNDSDSFLWPSIIISESSFAIIMAILNVWTTIRSW